MEKKPDPGLNSNMDALPCDGKGDGGRPPPHGPPVQSERSAEVAQMPLVPGTGKNLHANGVTDGDVRPKDLSDTLTYR